MCTRVINWDLGVSNIGVELDRTILFKNNTYHTLLILSIGKRNTLIT